MIDEGSLFFDTGLGAGVTPPPAIDAPPSVLLPDVLAAASVYIPQPYDRFGAITVPVQATRTGYPVGDPCLRYILDFIYAFVVTDANATIAWSQVYPALPPIRKTLVEDPRDLRAGTFSVEWLPALFMWRDSVTKEEWAAEDWLRETTTVKALWVFPLGLPSNQVNRQPYANALMKAINVGIERGRTPGYVVANDPDRRAYTDGSNFSTFAGFERFSLEQWRAIQVGIDHADKGTQYYPAIEMTFSLSENLEYGLDRFAPNSPSAGVYLTLLGPDGRPVLSGAL